MKNQSIVSKRYLNLVFIVFLAVLMLICTTWAKNTSLQKSSSQLKAYDAGWPRQIGTAKGQVMIYEPQIETMKGEKITARSAFSISLKDKTKQYYGTIWFNSRIFTNRETRTARLLGMNVTKVKMCHASAKDTGSLSNTVKAVFKNKDLTISMDRLITSLQVARNRGDDPDNLSVTPPNIIYVNYPAVLITIDGPPVLRPVSGTKLQRVMNSPFFIVRDSDNSTDYLYGGGNWYSANNITSNSWKQELNPPDEVVKLQKSIQKQVGRQVVKNVQPTGRIPEVVITTEPSELISSDGDPKYTQIGNTDLSYMSNTTDNVFYDQSKDRYYVLLSGRWFNSTSLDGPWTYIASDMLPDGFYSITKDSPKASVLASVAGTQDANEALTDAEIPQTATIRKDTPGPDVKYDGNPNFKKIEGTDMEWADNTPYQIIQVNNTFYCCYQGVWYQSDDPTGPWVVATSIPDDILNIPPSNPLFNCKYAYISGNSNDYVDVGYYPGYLGCYTFGPTIVWGTGFHYRGWYGGISCPRPITWGCSAGYIPWTSSWGFGIGYDPDWFDCGFGWGIGWDDWWGPFGFCDFDREFHHRRDFDDRGDFRDRDQDIFNRPENRRRNFDTPEIRHLQEIPRAQNQPNNIFADRNGDIHRRTTEGWQQRQANGWSKPIPTPENPSRGNIVIPRQNEPVQQRPVFREPTSPRIEQVPNQQPQRIYRAEPSIPQQQLEPAWNARQRGEVRSNDYNRNYSAPSTPRGSSIPQDGNNRIQTPSRDNNRSFGGGGGSFGGGRR